MKVLVVYYSMYGHMLQMARAVAKGAGEIDGIEVVLRRCEELPHVSQRIEGDEFMRKIRDSQADIPVCTADDFRQADGFVIGSPTRFGNMAAQVKSLIDGLGGLWGKGELEGKPAGVFTSTATTHGGQESTLISMMIPLIHLGMVIVGVPYSTPGMLHTEARGGTPYGATTIAGGAGELSPAPQDLEIAAVLGRRVAEITKKLRG
jgi:NAD(P)H dehydrogenase (quinone)